MCTKVGIHAFVCGHHSVHETKRGRGRKREGGRGRGGGEFALRVGIHMCLYVWVARLRVGAHVNAYAGHPGDTRHNTLGLALALGFGLGLALGLALGLGFGWRDCESALILAHMQVTLEIRDTTR